MLKGGENRGGPGTGPGPRFLGPGPRALGPFGPGPAHGPKLVLGNGSAYIIYYIL